MKVPRIVLFAPLIPAVAFLCFTSCRVFPPQDDLTHYYVLGSLDESGSSKKLANDSGLVVQFGPVSVATYLDRNQLISRKGPNEIEVAEFHVWGESLDEGISRVVTRNLSQLLDSSSVAPYPEVDLIEFDYRVGLLINRFEPTGKGSVVLDCTWGVGGAPGSDIKQSTHSSKITVPFDEPPADPPATKAKEVEIPSREVTAAAMTEAISRLSVEIADELVKRGKPEADGEEEDGDQDR